jgi:hypothetical protein
MKGLCWCEQVMGLGKWAVDCRAKSHDGASTEVDEQTHKHIRVSLTKIK